MTALAPDELERFRRLVEVTVLDGHCRRADIIAAVRRHRPIGTSALVVHALVWLRRQGRVHFSSDHGWQPGPPPFSVTARDRYGRRLPLPEKAPAP